MYRRWIDFALGRADLGRGALKNPSGKYASAISWKKTGQYQVTIYADSNISKQVDSVEHGAKAFNIKDIMLAAKSKTAKDGHKYRVIPMPPQDAIQTIPTVGTVESFMAGSPKTGQHIRASVAKLWAKPVARTRFVTMSDKPGSAKWNIPARPAYAPAQILADLIKSQYGQ